MGNESASAHPGPDHTARTTSGVAERGDADWLGLYRKEPHITGILLINLVENALCYPSAGRAVWVSVIQKDADTVEISVTDKGEGIPASARERIFERYVQLNTPATQRQGMGLGLFIVKRIAELHGGETCMFFSLATKVNKPNRIQRPR
ncbi:MAG: sensor histidine kinase [Methylococcaceae bacterium]|jgi:two-component system sensor histidine kinase SenX3